jgi:hypothetical protein
MKNLAKYRDFLTGTVEMSVAVEMSTGEMSTVEMSTGEMSTVEMSTVEMSCSQFIIQINLS